MSYKSVRLLVVGDSGVGKTCLVSYLCNGEPARKLPDWTVGCNVEVTTHKLTTPTGVGGDDVPYVLEFVDVGGHQKHQRSRSVFYNNVNGVILVYDMANLKSYKNLRKWIRELVEADSAKPDGVGERLVSSSPPTSSSGMFGSGSGSATMSAGATATAPPHHHHHHHPHHHHHSKPSSGLSRIPVLVVGNKMDLATTKTRKRKGQMVSLDLPSIETSASSGTVSNIATLHAFYDEVITHRHRPSSSASGSASKRTLGSSRWMDGRAALFAPASP